MTDKINDYIILFSVALTVPHILYCLDVIFSWHTNFLKSMKERSINAHDRLCKGIYIGFCGDFADYVYWGVTWLLFAFDYPLGVQLMLWGSVSNIIFRQGLGLKSAHEHVQAANLINRGSDSSLCKKYWLAGAASLALLITLYNY